MPQKLCLRTGKQVLSLDNRGMGKSDMPKATITMRRFCEDIKQIIENQGWKKIDLFGLVFTFSFLTRKITL